MLLSMMVWSRVCSDAQLCFLEKEKDALEEILEQKHQATS